MGTPEIKLINTIDAIVDAQEPAWLPRYVRHDVSTATSIIEFGMFTANAGFRVAWELPPKEVAYFVQDMVYDVMPRVKDAAGAKESAQAIFDYIRGRYKGTLISYGRSWSGTFEIPREADINIYGSPSVATYSAPIETVIIRKDGENVRQPFAYFAEIDRLVIFDPLPYGD